MNQIDKLREIVQYAYHHTAFYHRLYDRFSVDISNLNSVEELPVVKPQDLIDFPYEFKSDETLYKAVMTSGTVSQQKILFRTVLDFEQSVQNECLFLKWAGITANDTVCIVQPFGINGYGELTLEACRKMGIFAIPLGSADDAELARAVAQFSPTVLDISPSRLFTFLQSYKPQKIRLAMTAGEPITPDFKAKIKKKYGIDVINQYGATELDCLAAEKKAEEGLFLVQDSYIFETLHHQLTVTSLYHKGTPLIRYQLGDLAEISGEKISVYGRPSSVTLYDGIILESFQINKIIRKYNGSFWQCLIYPKNKHICVDLRIIGNSKADTASIKEEFINSQDFSDVIKSGKILFSCQAVSSFIGEERKKKNFIDARNCTDAMRVQLIQNRCFEAFYFSLPPVTAKFTETLFSTLEDTEIEIEILIDLCFYVIHFWTQKARKTGQNLLHYCYRKNSELTLRKAIQQACSPDWEAREEAAKIISVILNSEGERLTAWIRQNISGKDENIRRAFLVAIKYSAEYTHDITIQEKLLDFMDLYLYDNSKYVKKSFASFTIGDGFLNVCPDLVEKKINQWLKLNDNYVNCIIIRIFKSSGGAHTLPLWKKYLSVFSDNPDKSVQKALQATERYLNERISKREG